MNYFTSNLLMALAWAAMTANFSAGNLFAGFLLGYLVLWFAQRVLGRSRYFIKVYQILEFHIFFIKEIVVANLRVGYDVITPTHHMTPGFIAIPLDDSHTDISLTMLANMITLTPGTLSMDISDDHKILYLHAMYIKDPARLVDEIKIGFERRVLELLR